MYDNMIQFWCILKKLLISIVEFYLKLKNIFTIITFCLRQCTIFMTIWFWLLFLSHTYGQVVLYHRHFTLLFVYQSESWSQRSPPLSKPLICTICICIPNTFEKLIIQAWNIVNVIFAILWKAACIWSSFNIYRYFKTHKKGTKHWASKVQKAFI